MSRIGLCSIAAIACAASAQAQVSAGDLWRPEPGQRDYFGSWMESSEDTLVVNSKRRLDVYDASSGEPRWIQILTPDDFPDHSAAEHVPAILAVHGDWMVFGDTTLEVNGKLYAGVAYLFRRSGDGWNYFGRLTPSTPTAYGAFGASADLDGRTLAVGELNALVGAGSVHLYERTGEAWTEVQVLSDGKPNWSFGVDVAVDGEWLLVGSTSGEAFGHGRADFFRRDSANPGAPWKFVKSFQGGTNGPWEQFGRRVTLDGEHAAASDPGVSGGIAFNTWVFRRDGSQWKKVQELASPHKFPWSVMNPISFGWALELRGADLLLGSPNFSDSAGASGMAYHYRRNDSRWDLLAALVPPQQTRRDQLGCSVALAGGRAFAGAKFYGKHFEDSILGPTVVGAQGATYAFDLSPDAQQYCSCAADSPCANIDSHGGCANSTGAGGVLASAGSGSLAADDLRLQAFDLPPWQIAVLAIGDQEVAMPFGDGRLCVWGDVVQPPGMNSSVRGTVEWPPGLAGLAASLGDPIQPGESRFVQLFYRDPAGPCGTGINLTNAVRVDFGP